MELRDDPYDGHALFGRLVVAVAARLAVHEWEQCDRVALPDAQQRLATAGRNRSDHELEAAALERQRRVEGAPQAVKYLLARVSEPALLVEVVEGDEAASSV